jgi:hypothetical protein
LAGNVQKDDRRDISPDESFDGVVCPDCASNDERSSDGNDVQGKNQSKGL